MKRNDEEIRQLVTENIAIAAWVAKLFSKTMLDQDELCSLSMRALMDSARTWDPARGSLRTLTRLKLQSFLARWRRKRRPSLFADIEAEDTRPGPSSLTSDKESIARLRRLRDKVVARFKDDPKALDRIMEAQITHADVFSTGQVATIVRMSPNTIAKNCDYGTLDHYHVPKSKYRRIPREALVKWMNANGIPMEFLTDWERRHT